MNSLFQIPETLSPRLAWLKRHSVRTSSNPDMSYKDKPWVAWIGDLVICIEEDWFETGHTEDEALTNLAKALNIPLWNEEGFKR